MITTELVNTFIISHNYLFVHVMRTFKIYSHGNLQEYNTAVLIVVIMLYILLPGIIYLLAGNLIPLTNITSCPPPPQMLAITILLSVPMSTAFLDFIYIYKISYIYIYICDIILFLSLS